MNYGKFASAEELLKGYNELEKRFTQKCQQLAAIKAEEAAKTPVRLQTEKTEEGASKESETGGAVAAAEKTVGEETFSAASDSADFAPSGKTDASRENVFPPASLVSGRSAQAESAEGHAYEFAPAPITSSEENMPSVGKKTLYAPVAPRPEDAKTDNGAISSDPSLPLGEPTRQSESRAVCEPGTLSAARDAAEKLFQTAYTAYDGTSAETPPSFTEAPDAVAGTPVRNAADASLSNGTAFVPTESMLQQYLLNNPQFARRLLQQTSRPPQIMTGGGNVSLALPSRPKTIKEASLMAKQLFKD